MFRSLLLSSALALVSLPALARENYALLIGANEYRNLDERWWLNGPANDVELVRDYLLTEAPVPFAADNVTLLTDNVDGVQPATLAAIRAAFAELTEKVQPGDFVYLHFLRPRHPGPATEDQTELDGLDELFLPVDIGKWDDGVGHVENALVDDEIGRLIDGCAPRGPMSGWCSTAAIPAPPPARSTLATTTCAPASWTPRSWASTSRRWRTWSAAAWTTTPRARRGAVRRDRCARRRRLSSPSCRPDQRGDAREEAAQGPARPQAAGRLHLHLLETLAEYPNATYGQIAARGAAALCGQEPGQDRRRCSRAIWTQVVFSGEGGGRVTAVAGRPRRTAASRSRPGSCTGCRKARLAVMATAADRTDALGYVELTSVSTFASTGQAVDPGRQGPAGRIAEGPDAAQAGPGRGFHPDGRPAPEAARPADALLSAMQALQEVTGPRLNFVAPGAEADLRLAVLPDSPRPDAIWVLPATGLAEDLRADALGLDGRQGRPKNWR
jgi:hypothetical protein